MDKQERLKKMLELLNEDRPSSKEVASLVLQLTNVIKETRDTLRKEANMSMSECKDMCNSCETALKSVENRINVIMSKSNKDIQDKWYKELNNEVYKLEKLISDIPQFDSSKLEAKWTSVISDLDIKIKDFKQLTAFDIRDLLESIVSSEDKLDKSAVKGIDTIENDIKEIRTNIKSIELRPTGRGTSVGIQLYVDGVRKGRVSTINLVAGSGITLTHAISGQRNDILIDSTGGGGFTELAITGTIDDSNVTFTAASEPTYLIINGAMYKKTGGAITWSYSVGNITLSSPVGQGGSIYGLS